MFQSWFLHLFLTEKSMPAAVPSADPYHTISRDLFFGLRNWEEVILPLSPTTPFSKIHWVLRRNFSTIFVTPPSSSHPLLTLPLGESPKPWASVTHQHPSLCFLVANCWILLWTLQCPSRVSSLSSKFVQLNNDVWFAWLCGIPSLWSRTRFNLPSLPEETV